MITNFSTALTSVQAWGSQTYTTCMEHANHAWVWASTNAPIAYDKAVLATQNAWLATKPHLASFATTVCKYKLEILIAAIVITTAILIIRQVYARSAAAETHGAGGGAADPVDPSSNPV